MITTEGAHILATVKSTETMTMTQTIMTTMMMTPTTLTTVEEALHENAPNLLGKARAITIVKIRKAPKIKEDVQDLLFTEHGPLEDDD